MQILTIIAEVFAVFTCLATGLPYIRTDKWWIRIFDFPRVQICAFGIGAFVLFLVLFNMNSLFDHILMSCLAIAFIIQGWHIFAYTPIASKLVKDASGNGPTIRLLMANVQQDNQRIDELKARIKEADADIVLLSEVNDRWDRELRYLKEFYPHTLLHPQENTYGMDLYSRLPLIGPQVRYLIDDDVPSIRTRVRMENGLLIHFYGVHPRPPGIKDGDRKERQDSTQRDAELVVVAKEVVQLDEPVIVAGDFNDVAWSHTTRLFQRTSRLLDPRRGRGFYNSFNAKSFLFRYPLDHLFHSDHFTLMQIKRLKKIGSDHFPICIRLMWEQHAEHKQEAPEKKSEDEQEARRILDRDGEQ